MKQVPSQKDIWFIYDGECPLCTKAALALRIKQDYATLNLLNAREISRVSPRESSIKPVENALIQEINAKGYDLDEGMIIYDGEHFYHGKDALCFMAKYADYRGVFNLATKALYWSDSLAKITYPWLRGVRNRLLRKNQVPRIDNLNARKEPIFKSIFAETWDQLPSVMHRHYANRPYTNDVVIVEGELSVMCAGPVKLFSPLLRLVGSVPPYTQQNVPVTVRFESEPDEKIFRFNRRFYFNSKPPYVFQSYMMQTDRNEVAEVMRFGFAWLMQYAWQDDRVKLKHQGYGINAFGHLIPLPLTWLLGEVNAEEIAVDENTFDMCVQMTHPLWGKVYEYKGRFEIKATP